MSDISRLINEVSLASNSENRVPNWSNYLKNFGENSSVWLPRPRMRYWLSSPHFYREGQFSMRICHQEHQNIVHWEIFGSSALCSEEDISGLFRDCLVTFCRRNICDLLQIAALIIKGDSNSKASSFTIDFNPRPTLCIAIIVLKQWLLYCSPFYLFMF